MEIDIYLPDLRLFRPSRPDFIETFELRGLSKTECLLFRPSRPDFIETSGTHTHPPPRSCCSGLLGRTSLRQFTESCFRNLLYMLFRPSRPDFIETLMATVYAAAAVMVVPAF